MLTQQNIILVHPDEDTNENLTAYFRQKKIRLTCFRNSRSAIEAALDSSVDWNFIISDFLFSDISEVEFKNIIKDTFPQISAIKLPHLSLKSNSKEALGQRTFNFIKHDIDYTEILKLLQNELIEKKKQCLLNGTKSEKQRKSIIGDSPSFTAALSMAERVSSCKASIFISGESGTGKEVFAKYIHQCGPLKSGKFVAINCSAIPENLLESELFGHAKGAYTGAVDKKIGLFEEAENGTLFLDEIGDLSLPLQAKLLRVLQERKIRRVGENAFRSVNCRIISATHKNIEIMVQNGQFREDLFFRLNVIPINLPPLRERQEDILPLAQYFLNKASSVNKSAPKFFSKEAAGYLRNNSWRGNVRELENSIERAFIMSDGPEIAIEDFMHFATKLKYKSTEMADRLNAQNCFSLDCEQESLPTLEEVIGRYIEYAVNTNNGQRDKTAKEIGIDRKTLYKRMRKSSVTLH